MAAFTAQLVSADTAGRVTAEGLLAAAEAVGITRDARDIESALGSLLLSITGSQDDPLECTVADVAGISLPDLETTLGSWMVSSRPAKVMMKSLARRVQSACLAACQSEWAPRQPAAASSSTDLLAQS